MHLLSFLGIALLAAGFATAAIVANAMRIDKDPAIDGPRALLAEFFGLWIAFAFLAWSFMIPGPPQLQWILRAISAGSAIIAFVLAAYFAGTPEVRVRLDQEPTGFDTPITALQLLEYHALHADENSEPQSPRRNQTWSDDLNPQV
jgi:hypothetical protein